MAKKVVDRVEDSIVSSLGMSGGALEIERVIEENEVVVDLEKVLTSKAAVLPNVEWMRAHGDRKFNFSGVTL